MANFTLICLFWCAENFSLNNWNRSGCVFVWLYGFCLRLLLWFSFFSFFFLLWRVSKYTYYTRRLFYKHFFFWQIQRNFSSPLHIDYHQTLCGCSVHVVLFVVDLVWTLVSEWVSVCICVVYVIVCNFIRVFLSLSTFLSIWFCLFDPVQNIWTWLQVLEYNMTASFLNCLAYKMRNKIDRLQVSDTQSVGKKNVKTV